MTLQAGGQSVATQTDDTKHSWLQQGLNKLQSLYLKENLFLTLFGLFKVPMLFYLKPRIMELSDTNCAIKIPLCRRSKNHVGSMYFAVLAAGADCAGGLLAMKMIYERKLPVQLVFKDFKANFLKRAEDDVLFLCQEGQQVKAWVDEAMRTGERVNGTVHVVAHVPSSGHEPVAEFELTLSLKKRRP